MIHTLVCLKQVPDTTQVRISPETGTLIREGVPSIVNPYDMHAIEEALRLKERYGGRITAISMGPLQAREALQKAVSLGVDETFLLSDRFFAGADTWATSYALAEAVLYFGRERPVDLVICGKQSIDGDTAQVGPGIAARLGWTQLTCVDAVLEIDAKARTIRVRRKLEGAHETLVGPLPAVLTVVKEINEPRRAKLPDLIRALRTVPPVVSAADLKLDPDLTGLKGSPTKVRRVFPPPVRTGGELIRPAGPDEAVRLLMDRLAHAGLLDAVRRGGTAAARGRHVAPAGAVPAIPLAEGRPGEGARGVWVFVEQVAAGAALGAGAAPGPAGEALWGGAAAPVSWELLGIARELAADLYTEPAAIVLGHKVDPLVREAIAYGAATVYAIDDPILARYRTQPFTHALTSLVKRYNPEILLLGATTTGRDLASAVATRVRTGLTADCTGLAIDKERQILEQTRPAFGGNIMATILTENHRPQMSTVRPRVMPMPARDPGMRGRVIREKLGLDEKDVGVKVLELVGEDLAATVNLDDAEVIVAGGRGMGSKENFRLLEELAGALGGVVAASRAAVDAKWISYAHQVGQTGRTVRPRLYIACGISGAVQHLVGMQTSDAIIAINSDPAAPIFSVATWGVVGNAVEIVPALTAALGAAGFGSPAGSARPAAGTLS
jgi:electron transfer flavoprotein alpha subunit